MCTDRRRATGVKGPESVDRTELEKGHGENEKYIDRAKDVSYMLLCRRMEGSIALTAVIKHSRKTLQEPQVKLCRETERERFRICLHTNS